MFLVVSYFHFQCLSWTYLNLHICLFFALWYLYLHFRGKEGKERRYELDYLYPALFLLHVILLFLSVCSLFTSWRYLLLTPFLHYYIIYRLYYYHFLHLLLLSTFYNCFLYLSNFNSTFTFSFFLLFTFIRVSSFIIHSVLYFLLTFQLSPS